jgi:predicted dehydrogenase
MKKVRLGLIGLGYIGKIHLRHCLKLDNAKLVAVSDLSKKALKTAKNASVKKTFTDYEQLLKDPDINAVIIALPTHLHLQCAKQAAEAKKHIFLEKPIAKNTTEAKEIISAAQRNSIKLMIGYPLRFDTAFRNLKEKIKSGTLGDIEIAHATYISTGPFFHRAESQAPAPVPEWWFNKELTGGGALIDTGIHIINLLRWYFGEITDIKSHLGYRFNMDLEDSATCLAKFKSGTIAVINAGWFSQEFRLEIELLGSVSHITVQRLSPNPLFTAVQMLTSGTSKFFQSHFAELQYFTNCIIKDLPPSPSGQDGLKDLEIITRAYKNQMHLEKD